MYIPQCDRCKKTGEAQKYQGYIPTGWNPITLRAPGTDYSGRVMLLCKECSEGYGLPSAQSTVQTPADRLFEILDELIKDNIEMSQE